MEEENMVSQEQKVQAQAEDDGVIKVDLRNFKQEELDALTPQIP